LRKRGYFTLLSTVLVAISINFSDTAHSIVITPINSLQNSILELKDGVSNYFGGCNRVDELEREIERLHRVKALLPTYNRMVKALGNNREFQDLKLYRVQPLSYINIGDFSQVSLHFPEFKHRKIYGLIRDGKSSGVVSEIKGRPVALLQSSQLCSYGVNIGEVQAPGVIKGRRDGLMSVHFIPNWLQIKAGDRVKTSGLDRIFPKGVPVGKVLSVEKSGLYQIATVEPYVKQVVFDYLFAVDTGE
jgi:rod shape-determining protein MreC